MSNANDKLYYFTNVTLTVDGENYSVASLDLQSYENAIPAARAVINPMDTGAGGKAADLGEFIAVWTKLSKKALAKKMKTTATLTVNGEDGVELELKDWLLVAAGVENVSADGSFSVVAMFLHPVAGSDVSAMAFFNSPKNVEYPGKKGGNIVEAWLQLFQAFLTAQGASAEAGGTIAVPEITRVESVTTPEFAEIDKKILGKLAAARQILEDNVIWKYDGSGFPLESQSGGLLQDSVCHAIWNSFQQSGATPWQMFLGALSSMLCAIRGGFDGKPMEVYPNESWNSPDAKNPPPPIKILPDHVAQLQLPVASDPVAAVVVQGAKPMSPVSQMQDTNVMGGRENQQWQEMHVLGAYIDMFDKVEGRVLAVSLPPWFSAMQSERTYDGQGGGPAYTNKDLNSDDVIDKGYDSTVKAAIDTDLEMLKTCAAAYAKDIFCWQYGVDSRLQVGVRYMLKFNGEWLKPGFPASVGSSEGGDKAARFYLYGVSHTLDASGGAGTTLYGSHVSSVLMEPTTSEMFKGGGGGGGGTTVGIK
jgi:hypothetical protein